MVACNDYILLESCIYRILQRHFSLLPYYAQLLELFHEVNDWLTCGEHNVVLNLPTQQSVRATLPLIHAVLRLFAPAQTGSTKYI